MPSRVAAAGRASASSGAEIAKPCSCRGGVRRTRSGTLTTIADIRFPPRRTQAALVDAGAAGYFEAMPDLLSLKTKLSTPLLAETRDWYRDLFDLAVLEEWDEPGDQGCILGLPGTAAGAHIEIHRCAAPPNFAGVSLQFRVDDVAAFAVPDDPRFRHRGPVDRPWGSRYLFFSDPNGLSVVVFSGTSL